MRLRPARNLVEQTVVLPEAYQDADRRENVAAARSWTMVKGPGLILCLRPWAKGYIGHTATKARLWLWMRKEGWS